MSTGSIYKSGWAVITFYVELIKYCVIIQGESSGSIRKSYLVKGNLNSPA